MPSLDFETLISLSVAGDSGKVLCETTLPTISMADLPAESVLIPLDQHIDWMDRNSATHIYEREDSTKGPSNPKSHHPNGTINNNNNNGNSQRFSGNLNPIGLPRKPASIIGIIGNSQRFSSRPRFFPKKKAVSDSEPASPKVSCCGKVLSDRERPRPKGGGFFRRIICCGCRQREAEMGVGELVGQPERRKQSDARAEAPPVPGLGAMKRFASGRSWASLDGDELERSGPLDVGEERDGAVGVGCGRAGSVYGELCNAKKK